MGKIGLGIYRFFKDEEGPTAVEYALMAFLVIVVCMVAIISLGQNTNSLYQNNVDKISVSSR